MPIDYSLGKIYRIVCNVSGKQYIGSTCQSLSKRLAKHRLSYRVWEKNKKIGYVRSYDIIKNGDYSIVLIELYPCQSKYELERRERHFIETMDCVNIIKPAPTVEEAIISERESKQKWVEHNKDKILQNKKRYREQNREILNEKNRQYYEQNKDKIHSRSNTKHSCVCGGNFTSANKAQHLKTKKHQAWEGSQPHTNEP